ncbi:enoyl-CoA hydratase/isomerase family protein [Streptomonospora nanhaiensis]|uniref:Enoyl-CoA hydratase/carnithine racemase n=1 Tax=Streptomonospora nanhaiensis TaxID=1323731 RepID=A0A853BUI9_9ACTN|nr:enoyl-CoA hydratase/isomerase family protein [Streptomonospora nanhaiensis]MBX9387105.1 enoyl-CoA hydratase/isomerase family protein [Streptomonospora nanhaiensis]NYI98958.1 enoyl-CoA hydratase/carnithine racemase [Streptomonospora nanhaiensis]
MSEERAQSAENADGRREPGGGAAGGRAHPVAPAEETPEGVAALAADQPDGGAGAPSPAPGRSGGPAFPGAGGSGTDQLHIVQEGPVLTVTFNRPAQRNAMTWAMYDGLVAACERADADDAVRAMVLTGAGDAAFVAGTDIAQFTDFTDGADGVAYEARLSAVVDRLAQVRVPTVAAVRGYCVGGGLAVAAACDLRVATPSARFGVPIARTLGNCLSVRTHALLAGHFGAARTLDLLLTARLMDAEEARVAGFVTRMAAEDALEAEVAALTDRLAAHAPLSMWAAKESARRLRTANLPEDRDILERVYGSADFRNAVRSFTAKTAATWEGR